MEHTNPLSSFSYSKARKMLDELFSLFRNKFQNSKKAWDHFLEFILIDNSGEMIFQIKNDFDWLFNDKRFLESLLSVYDSTILKSEYHDHLGNMYFEYLAGKNQKFKPSKELKDNIQKVIEQNINKKNNPIKLLDKNASTGRNLMIIHKSCPDVIYFGVEKDLNLFRIALVNCAIHEIECFLLNANSKIHNVDISTDNGFYNWLYANKWDSYINKLKKIDVNHTMNNSPTPIKLNNVIR